MTKTDVEHLMGIVPCETKYLRPNEVVASVVDYEILHTPSGARLACVLLETLETEDCLLLADRFPVPSWVSTRPAARRWREFHRAIKGQYRAKGALMGCRVIVARDKQGNVAGYSPPILPTTGQPERIGPPAARHTP